MSISPMWRLLYAQCEFYILLVSLEQLLSVTEHAFFLDHWLPRMYIHIFVSI